MDLAATLPSEHPRPHPFFEARGETLTVNSRSFGPLSLHVRTWSAPRAEGEPERPPLLLIHGLMTSSYTWRDVIAPLGRHFTLYMPDLPGSGQSPPLAAKADPEQLGFLIEDLQKALGHKRCPVVASDLGAYLAMRTVLGKRRGKPSISRLACIHPPTGPEPWQYLLKLLLQLPGARDLLGWAVRSSPDAWLRTLLKLHTPGLMSLEMINQYAPLLSSTAGSRAFVDTIADTLDPNALETFHASLRLFNFTERRFPTPTLFIYGDSDAIIPPAHGDHIEQFMPDAKVIRVVGSSRLVQLDAPDRLVAYLLEFLKEA